jgi:hypothetical protein
MLCYHNKMLNCVLARSIRIEFDDYDQGSIDLEGKI